MRHVHADMIIAKAENMDLVVFENDQHGPDDWYEIDSGKLPVNAKYTYFLCLPQHKEACLHWLNGGDIEFLDSLAWNHYFCSGWASSIRFMSNTVKLRIKPRKEKRWIVVNTKTMKTGLNTYESEQDAINDLRLDMDWQPVEIEVEV